VAKLIDIVKNLRSQILKYKDTYAFVAKQKRAAFGGSLYIIRDTY